MNYKTKQQDGVLKYLNENAGAHVTAEDIRENARNGDSQISLATVYRQLDKLVEQGLVIKYETDKGSPACFEYIDPNLDINPDKEFHCRCISCGALIHIRCREISGIEDHLLKEHHFLIDPKRTVFYGHCENCQKAQKKI